jgi:protoheme IX farnesyltransferase
MPGFFLPNKIFLPILIVSTMAAIACGIAAACIVNNYIDIGIDSKMNRTKKRALVTGDISVRNALILAVLLATISIALFIIFTNLITLLGYIVGLFFYLILYSISKRRTSWSTVIGCISAAIIPVAGYTAVTGKIDLTAVLLFLTLVFWQMPHFYTIGIYRRREYENAHLPVLPVASGVTPTKIQILFFTIAFAVVVILLSLTSQPGIVYLIIMPALSIAWVVYAFGGFFTKYVDKWARKMFFFSLIINVMWCITIIVGYFIP